MACCSFWQNEAKRVNGAAAVRVTRAIQPQQCKREAAFHCVRGLPVGNSKHSEVRRTASEKAAGVIARNGMPEIGRDAQRLERFIGKLFREETAERIAEGFTREVALGALVFEANKFEAVG